MTWGSVDRRTLLAGGASVAAGAAAGLAFGPMLARGLPTQRVLEPRETVFELTGDRPTRSLFSYSARGLAPELRVKQNDTLNVLLRNGLDEPTTIHWHGIRLPNRFDGVPFLTQPVVFKNETFSYSFAPPDAGTYWYHPHCNSLVQMGRGLTGVLIVEESNDPGFDADIALNLRDWRLGPDGQFTDLFLPRQAARAGTLGTVRTVNWRQDPMFDAPSGGLVRLRLAVTDVTRVYRPAIEGAAASLIALDGNPLPTPRLLNQEALAPGQRMDVIVRMPDDEGAMLEVRDRTGPAAVTLAKLRSMGTSLRRDLREVAALPANPIPPPDLSTATAIAIELTATAERIAKSPFCGDLGYSFWAINHRPWPGSSPDPTAPIAELKLGRSYILNLHNRTPHAHPIHLHGLSFQLLRSDRRTLSPQMTDTVLILADERLDIALVADNPGDWLLHCHVIEHQETGMSGFIRVT